MNKKIKASPKDLNAKKLCC